MRKPVAFRLADIASAIEEIEVMTAGHTEASFATDRKTRLAVERLVEILSEASRHLPDDLKTEHPELPWRAIADVGNVLRHAYDIVDPKELWDIVGRDLPALKRAVSALRAKSGKR